MLKLGKYWPWNTVSSHFQMPVRPMLLHRMALVSFQLFCKNLDNLQEFFGQMVYSPTPWQKNCLYTYVTDTWPKYWWICRLTYLGSYISAEGGWEWSYWSSVRRHIGRYVDQASPDTSTNISTIGCTNYTRSAITIIYYRKSSTTDTNTIL